MLAATPSLNHSPQSGDGAGADAAPDASGQLALLDDAQEWSAFSRPLEGQAACWESSVVFEGMHCAACALTIEDALRAVPGVQSVRVSAATHLFHPSMRPIMA